VSASNGAFDFPFDSAPGGNEFATSGARSLAGSTLTWAAAHP